MTYGFRLPTQKVDEHRALLVQLGAIIDESTTATQVCARSMGGGGDIVLVTRERD